jgi:hypothetical protein
VEEDYRDIDRRVRCGVEHHDTEVRMRRKIYNAFPSVSLMALVC